MLTLYKVRMYLTSVKFLRHEKRGLYYNMSRKQPFILLFVLFCIEIFCYVVIFE